jgi:hypothetical protein
VDGAAKQVHGPELRKEALARTSRVSAKDCMVSSVLLAFPFFDLAGGFTAVGLPPDLPLGSSALRSWFGHLLLHKQVLLLCPVLLVRVCHSDWMRLLSNTIRCCIGSFASTALCENRPVRVQIQGLHLAIQPSSSRSRNWTSYTVSYHIAMVLSSSMVRSNPVGRLTPHALKMLGSTL